MFGCFFLRVSLDGEKLKGGGESVLGEEMRRILKRGESLCGDSLLFFFFPSSSDFTSCVDFSGKEGKHY